MSSSSPPNPLTKQQHLDLLELLQSLKAYIPQLDPLAHFALNPDPHLGKETNRGSKAATDLSPSMDNTSNASKVPIDQSILPPVKSSALTKLPTQFKDPASQLSQGKSVTKARAKRDFSELFRWMKNNYPKISLRAPEANISSAPVLIIAPEGADAHPASAFAADVVRGLKMRKIGAQLLSLEQSGSLQKTDERKYLLLADTSLVQILQSQMDRLEIDADIVPVDWLRCSQSALLKSALWRAIQQHLQVSS